MDVVERWNLQELLIETFSVPAARPRGKLGVRKPGSEDRGWHFVCVHACARGRGFPGVETEEVR